MDLEVNLVTIGLPGGSGTSAKKQKILGYRRFLTRQKHHLSAHYNFMGRGNVTPSVSLSGSPRQEAQFLFFPLSHLLNIYLKSGIESCFKARHPNPSPLFLHADFLFRVSRVSNIIAQNSNSLSCLKKELQWRMKKYGCKMRISDYFWL